MRAAPVLFLALAACSPSPGAANPPNGAVVDSAEVISAADEAQLDERLRQYWKAERTSIVVASVDSLEDKPIEKVAGDLFSQWSIGDAKTNRGLLILIAPTEKEMRIEVGCGLETVITDAFAKEVVETNMIPEFKSGDFAGGTSSGVEALIARLASSTVEPGPTSPFCVELMKKAA